MAKGTPAPAPKININPLANVKMPLQQAIQAVTPPPNTPVPVAPVITVMPRRPLV